MPTRGGRGSRNIWFFGNNNSFFEKIFFQIFFTVPFFRLIVFLTLKSCIQHSPTVSWQFSNIFFFLLGRENILLECRWLPTEGCGSKIGKNSRRHKWMVPYFSLSIWVKSRFFWDSKLWVFEACIFETWDSRIKLNGRNSLTQFVRWKTFIEYYFLLFWQELPLHFLRQYQKIYLLHNTDHSVYIWQINCSSCCLLCWTEWNWFWLFGQMLGTLDFCFCPAKCGRKNALKLKSSWGLTVWSKYCDTNWKPCQHPIDESL